MTHAVSPRCVRLAVALIGAAALWMGTTAPAQAHATLESTDPADGQVVLESPETITVTFDEPVSLAPSGNELLDATGEPVDAEFAARDNTVTLSPVETLADGTYIVSWRVISLDTHPVAGGISFSVGEPSQTVVDVPSEGEVREVVMVKAIAEIVRYAGLLGFAGLAAFGVFFAGAARGRSEAFRRRSDRVTAWLAGAAVVGGGLLVPLVTMWQDGASLSAFFSADIWGRSILSEPAAAWAVMVVGVVMALLAKRSARPVMLAAGLAVALGSVAVVGHTRAYGPPWLLLSADLLHVTTAAVWLGGVLGLSLLLLPDRQVRADEVAVAVARFSGAALWLIVGLVIAAVALYWRIAGSFDGLLTTGYGRLTLAKASLVLVIAAVAAWNRFRLVPSIVRNHERDRQFGLLRRTLAWEAGLLAIVLGVTGVLVSQTPREATVVEPVAPEALVTFKVGSAEATMLITPARRGINSAQLSLTTADGSALEPYDVPRLSVSLKSSELGPFNRPLVQTAPGKYEATVDFPLPGTWDVTLSVRLSEFENPVVTEEVEIP